MDPQSGGSRTEGSPTSPYLHRWQVIIAAALAIPAALVALSALRSGQDDGVSASGSPASATSSAQTPGGTSGSTADTATTSTETSRTTADAATTATATTGTATTGTTTQSSTTATTVDTDTTSTDTSGTTTETSTTATTASPQNIFFAASPALQDDVRALIEAFDDDVPSFDARTLYNGPPVEVLCRPQGGTPPGSDFAVIDEPLTDEQRDTCAANGRDVVDTGVSLSDVGIDGTIVTYGRQQARFAAFFTWLDERRP